MPKIQEYEELTSHTDINDNHLFITEQKNTTSTTYPTKIVSFKNLWKRVWYQIMNYINEDYYTTRINKDWTNLKITIQGQNVGKYWRSGTNYLYGDLIIDNHLANGCALYRAYAHTSANTWEEDASEWELVSAFADYAYFSIHPDEWSDTKPYTCTSTSYSNRISEYTSVIVDFHQYENAVVYNGEEVSRDAQIASYNCIDKIAVDNTNKTFVFTCYNKKPTVPFYVKLHITYNDSWKNQDDMFIMHRTSGNVIDDNIIESDTKTWSTKKIMEVISAFTDTNKLEVFSLPETGTSGIIYKSFSDEEGFIKCNGTQEYGEYIWLNSENKYMLLGEYSDLLVLVNSLPELGEKGIKYLILDNAETNQYSTMIWNDTIQNYESMNSIIIPTEVPIIKEILLGQAYYSINFNLIESLPNCVYKQCTLSGKWYYYIQDTTKNKCVCIGGAEVSEGITQPTQVLIPQLPTVSGLENMIYHIRGNQLYTWDTITQSFVWIGTYNRGYEWRDYKVVASLPSSSTDWEAYKYIYRVVDTEDTSKFKEYICSTMYNSTTKLYDCTYTLVGISEKT